MKEGKAFSMTDEVTSPAAAAASIHLLDQLLTTAVVQVSDRWDEASSLIAECVGITMELAAEHPVAQPAVVSSVTAVSASECVVAALREIQRWDLELVPDYPDITRLRTRLVEAHRLLAAPGER